MVYQHQQHRHSQQQQVIYVVAQRPQQIIQPMPQPQQPVMGTGTIVVGVTIAILAGIVAVAVFSDKGAA